MIEVIKLAPPPSSFSSSFFFFFFKSSGVSKGYPFAAAAINMTRVVAQTFGLVGPAGNVTSFKEHKKVRSFVRLSFRPSFHPPVFPSVFFSLFHHHCHFRNPSTPPPPLLSSSPLITTHHHSTLTVIITNTRPFGGFPRRLGSCSVSDLD
jgi:hypothetical protein